MLVGLSLSWTAVAAPTGVSEWQLDIKGEQTANQVKLEHETQPISFNFQPDGSAHQFRASLHVDDLLGSIPSIELTQPFQLVIDWAGSSETLYVTISRLTPPPRVEIGIDAPRQSASFGISDLDAIDIMAGDLNTMVAKYLRARRFHLYWRGKGQREHQVAIRSARIWFDTATILSTRQQRVFRADSDINGIVDEYLAMAANDPTGKLAKRIQAQFPARLVKANRAQVAAAPFAVVGEIPALIAEGKIVEATRVNSAALRSLAGGTDEMREAVLSTQGVNVKVLTENGRYLDSLE